MTAIRELRIMRRRALLATAGLTALSGCTRPHLPTICSRPSFRADRLDFEAREFRTLARWSMYHPGAVLATKSEHLERFEPHKETAELLYENLQLTADERTFIEDTNFEESILVGVVVHTNTTNTDARVTHVVNGGEHVHCYVCIRWRDGTHVGGQQARLIRIHEPWSPEKVRVTFTDGEVRTEQFESEPTRVDLAYEPPTRESG